MQVVTMCYTKKWGKNKQQNKKPLKMYVAFKASISWSHDQATQAMLGLTQQSKY